MAGILTDLIQNFDMEKANKLWQQFYDGFAKFTGAYIYPNGMLGDTPVFISSFEWQTSTNVTSNITFEGTEIADNVSTNPYGAKIKIVAFTDFYIDVIELHQKAARNSNGQKGLMAFYYNKFKQLYGLVVITNMNFTNTSKDTFIQLIDIDLKFVEVRKFVTNEDGVITTETLGANNFFQDQQLLAEGMPQNWFDELSRTDKFKEIENAVKNSINI